MLPRLVLVVLLLVALPLAGCVGDRGGGGAAPGGETQPTPTTPTGPSVPTPDPHAAVVAAGPWWEEGRYFEFELVRGDETPRTYRLVNMWNDSASSHFWLGVKDRALAMEHALFDVNPFLGRIHWSVLAPHERGQHATMYSFPLTHDKVWGGMLLAGDWELRAAADPARPGAFVITGRGADGSTIAYDYDPKVEWFTNVEIKDSTGATTLRATLKAHGADEKGTFWFHRGVDYHSSTAFPQGVSTQSVTVADDGLHFLVLRVDLSASAPVELQLLDPEGNLAHREAVAMPTGGALEATVELPAPATGDWTLRVVSVGETTGEVRVTGIFETTRTV